MTCVRRPGSARGCRVFTVARTMLLDERCTAIDARQPVPPPEDNGPYRRVSRYRQSFQDIAAPVHHACARLIPQEIGPTR